MNNYLTLFRISKLVTRFLLNFRNLSGAKECRFCRSRKMRKNEPALTIVAVDTEENERLRFGVNYSVYSFTSLFSTRKTNVLQEFFGVVVSKLPESINLTYAVKKRAEDCGWCRFFEAATIGRQKFLNPSTHERTADMTCPASLRRPPFYTLLNARALTWKDPSSSQRLHPSCSQRRCLRSP